MYAKSIRKLYGGNPVTIICWSVSLMMLLILASPALSLAGTSPLYRFWSPVNERHFYTMVEAEKDKLIDIYAHVWTYESIAYYAFETDSELGLGPVYRFWSPVLIAHFYTIDETEKNKLIDNYPHVWTYEGIAFYAYPEGQQPVDAEEVYRFWSPVLETHFYTMDETEKNKLIDNYPHVWTYESIAWYAFSSPPGPFQGTITEIYDLPATSSTGTYTLKWRVIQGLGSNVSYILEDSDISFPNPTPYWTYAGERSYLFTDKPDGTYYYRVMVGSVNSAYSDPASITVNKSAAAIPSLSGPSSATEAFELTWTYDWPGGLGSNWDGYSLEYSDTPSNSGFEELGFYNSTSSLFTVTITPDPPDFDKTFYFRVRAYAWNSGWSGYSNVISVYIAPSTLPAPTNLAATQGDFTDQIWVAFNAVPGADHYHVYQATSAYGQYTLLGDTAPFDPTEQYIIVPISYVTPNIWYYYKVSAVDAQDNEGTLSGYTAGYASSSTPTISAPYWVEATDGLDRYINVQWTSSQNAAYYKVYRSTTPSNPSYILSTAVTSIYQWMPAINDWQEYYYWVKAVDSQGNESDFSAFALGYCIDWGAPD